MTPLTIPDGVTLSERDGATVLSARTHACALDLSLSGGHVTSWIPNGHDETLWLSPLATFTPGITSAVESRS